MIAARVDRFKEAKNQLAGYFDLTPRASEKTQTISV